MWLMAIVLLPYIAGDCRLCSELWACIPAISSLICLLLILMAFRLAASLGLSTLVLNPFPLLLRDLAPVWAGAVREQRAPGGASS